MGAGFVRISTDSSFERDVIQAEGPVLVAFGASWCGPCRLMAPGLRALAGMQRDRLKVTQIDVDANPATTKSFGVETFPVCILFKDGQPVERMEGYMPLRKLETILAPYFGLI